MNDVANINYVDDNEALRVQDEFLRFLNEFTDDGGRRVYREGTMKLQAQEHNTIFVKVEHVRKYSASLCSSIHLQFYRFYPYLCRALRSVALELCDQADKQMFDRKELYVAFTGVQNRIRLRELMSDKIGALVRISGQVVRTHPVHPELIKGVFTCEECNSQVRAVEQQFRYTQPSQCANPQCQNRRQFSLEVNESTFVDFQKVRIQEIQAELPRGSIPRTLDVVVRGEQVEKVQPGDRCDVSGALIVIPDVAQMRGPGLRLDVSRRDRGRALGNETRGLSGLKALGVRDLNYRLAFLACTIRHCSPTFGSAENRGDETTADELWRDMLSDEKETMQRMSKDRAIAQHIVDSIFPNIFGHDEVKLGVMLMLFGGVPKRNPHDGTTLRGDINVCLIGDPSTAKSQILKTVEQFSPRAVYTSGKASSAAGLTAAVVKDEESFEFVIEAGALMLANNGVCCIDEFDKMDPKDQVAIHEAMEQQTISITKAGVKATLNARASILAAANPVGGRYDRSRPLKHNIQLSAPIMSRFDLFFVLIDESNEIVDYAIARRIIDTHRRIASKSRADAVYTVDEILKYITFARCFKPQISEGASTLLVSEYKRLRQGDSNNAATSSWRITVRQLESLIRLSEALARLHCEEEVTVEHVNQASKLLSKSIVRVEQPDIALADDDDLLLGDIDMMEAIDRAEREESPQSVLKERNTDQETPVEEDGTAEKSSAKKIDPKKLHVTFEKYKTITDMLASHIRRVEEDEAENEQWEGVRVSQLVTWYISMTEHELEDEEDFMVQKTICERIVRRLITDDCILIRLDDADDDDPAVVVHPNYVVDD